MTPHFFQFRCDYCRVRSAEVEVLPEAIPPALFAERDTVHTPDDPAVQDALPWFNVVLSQLPGWRLVPVEGVGTLIWCPRCPPRVAANEPERDARPADAPASVVGEVDPVGAGASLCKDSLKKPPAKAENLPPERELPPSKGQGAGLGPPPGAMPGVPLPSLSAAGRRAA